ncbi:DNA mismatch repair protein MutT [Oscillospiraceae bacterium]|nr:DNA mismatch repair protein MutT [Oscillospiraceae bacterium]BDF73405.1 DNA mismatch repair protein MutT [Oscillospiraceae bacterium]
MTSEIDAMNIIKVGIGVIIIKDDNILLGHRVAKGKDTGGIFEPDTWCLPGGKQEFNETIFEGAKREVKEETALNIWNLQVFSAVDDIQPNKHFVTIQVIAKDHDGELKIMEPDKQDEWKWFSLNDLPKNIYSPSDKFIRAYLKSKR